MTRKRARLLMLELCRRLYLTDHEDLKGFGKIAKFYDDDWRHLNYKTTGGYKKAWESDLMKQLRASLGM